MLPARVSRALPLVAAMAVATACRGPEAPSAPLVSGAPPRPAPAPDAAPTADAGPGDAGGSDGGLAALPPCQDEDKVDAVEGSGAPPDVLSLSRVAFNDLPGWADDRLAEAVPAFLRSCEKLRAKPDDAPMGHDGHGGLVRDWRKACRAAARVPAGDEAAARAMFEAEFVPYAAAGTAGPIGKLTGYYVAEIHASRTRRGKYQVPVIGRPKDLVMVDLSAYIKDAHGRRIWGRMAGAQLVPYYTRQEIRGGALASRGLEILWADDAVDVLFAQIEGSAKATLDDGSVVWLEFAGKNGRAHKGVGGILRGGGFLAKGEGTMLGIRNWFRDHPARFDEIADQDASYVFFQVSARPGAVGSQTVLTPRRSIAVDRAFIAMSTPVWVDAKAPVPGQKGIEAPWRQLLIAQDTGGGIVGAVRGDVYWGDDAEAAERGGRMGGPGAYWLLLPPGVTQ